MSFLNETGTSVMFFEKGCAGGNQARAITTSRTPAYRHALSISGLYARAFAWRTAETGQCGCGKYRIVPRGVIVASFSFSHMTHKHQVHSSVVQ
jgi:hypothetical protein